MEEVHHYGPVRMKGRGLRSFYTEVNAGLYRTAAPEAADSGLTRENDTRDN